MTFDASTGKLSGTPAAGTGGTYTLHFTASNGVGSDATQTFTLTVDQAPAFTSANNTTFAVGSAGTFTVAASGFPAATLSESNSDNLPSGVTFIAATGVLSGTPAANTNGDYILHFTASNGIASDATQAFTLTVTSPFPFAGEYAVNAGGPLTLASITQNGSALTLNGTSSTAPATITDATHILVNGTDTATYGNSSLVFTTGTFAGQTWTKLDLPADYTNAQGAATHVIQNGNSLTFVNKFGVTSNGAWLSPTQVIATDWNNEVGTIANGAISWALGIVWSANPAPAGTSNGTGTTAISANPSQIIVDDYVNGSGNAVHVIQTGTSTVVFVDASGHMSLGTFFSSSQVTTPAFPGVVGTLSVNAINWSNGVDWTRTSPTSGITVTNYTNPSGIPVHLVQNGTNQVVFVDALSRISLGSINGTTVQNDLFPGVVGDLTSSSINWSNGIVWTQTASPLLLITRVTDADGAVSHVQVQSATTLVGLDGPLQGVTGTRVDDEIEWSNGSVWANFDYDILNALFEMGSGFP